MSEKVIITKADRTYELWKVEITDKYGFKTTVYEPTILNACIYVKYFFDKAEKRQKSREIENKAIESWLNNERKAGRTSNLD